MTGRSGSRRRAAAPEEAVCSAFRLGRLLRVEASGGTRNCNFIFHTEGGRWFARRIHPAYADPGRISFDHRFISFLADRGVPAAPPLAAGGGRTCLRVGDGLWEVFPFVEGRHLRDGRPADITALAAALAGLHRAGRRFRPRYEKAGPMGEADPRRILANAAKIRAENPEAAAALLPYCRLVKKAAGASPLADYTGLPHTLVHGDVQPGNILIRRGKVAAFVDFDWCAWRPRLYDLCFAILFCCAGHERPIGGGDIRRLTQTPHLEAGKVEGFLETYGRNYTRLSAAERKALTPLLSLVWCHARVSGALKVEGRERAEFLARPGLSVEDI